MKNPLRSVYNLLLERADVRLDGDRPWDPRIHDERVFRRVALDGSVGLGEAYVDGWWSTDDLEELARRLASARLERVTEWLPRGLAQNAAAIVSNQQTRGRARRVARQHYDFGNDLFAAFLGRYQCYSCGYFRDTDDLDVAQLQKLDLVCRKLDLRRGDRLLDVGGGWGELARHAAAEYGARVTSINISDEQMRFARERCRGLDVETVRCDYRDVRGSFDKVAAIAMFTHVGVRNYRTFMEAMRRVVAPEGTFLIEGVWGNVSTNRIDAWMDKHIFPGAMIPSGAQTFRAFEGIFVAEDVHNFGPDYVKTLRAWNARLRQAWPTLRARYDERVRKTFEYFFLTIAGFFRARALQHWHLVLTPPGAPQPAFCRLTEVRRERVAPLLLAGGTNATL
jgi:cyclopropane-fatty-acyl-phospholipid synthase